MDWTCSLLAPRVLAQRLLAARCALSHVVNASAPEIETCFDCPLNGSFQCPSWVIVVLLTLGSSACFLRHTALKALRTLICRPCQLLPRRGTGHGHDLPRCGSSPRRPERLAMPHTFSALPRFGAPAICRYPPAKECPRKDQGFGQHGMSLAHGVALIGVMFNIESVWWTLSGQIPSPKALFQVSSWYSRDYLNPLAFGQRVLS